MRKRLFCFMLAILLCVPVCSVATDAAGKVVKVTLEQSWKYGGPGPSIAHATIRGYDANGNVVWTTQDEIEILTEGNISEIGLTADKYYYDKDCIVVALDRETGKQVWTNSDFWSEWISTTVDSDGSIYVCGANNSDGSGTDIFGIIDANGQTRTMIPDFDAGVAHSLWPLNDTIVQLSDASYERDPAYGYWDRERGVEVYISDDSSHVGNLRRAPEHFYYVDLTDGSHSQFIHALVVGDLYDVSKKAWYADSVKWAVDSGMTNGTGEHTFSPHMTCTTAQILTLLWRGMGSPEPSIANPFTDVSTSDFYYKAALWAAEKGLVEGTSLRGETPCTRASTVNYLWKLSGSPKSGGASFSDVPANAAYAGAVSWAVGKSITSGTGNNLFSPNLVCDRAQIVTFLYRYLTNGGTATAGKTWSDAYQDFIFSESYLNFGDDWYKNLSYFEEGEDYSPIDFSLHDMDANGTPELIVYNGSDYALACWHAFSFDGDKVVYLGSLGDRVGSFEKINNAKYSGLYYRDDGHMGYTRGIYYTVRNGAVVAENVLLEDRNSNGGSILTEPIIEQHTKDDKLFDACQHQLGEELVFYTDSEIDQMGWNTFRAAYHF